MPFPMSWVWQAPGVLSVKFSHVAEASGVYLLETESGLLYFSASAPPMELSAEVAESLPFLSQSFKSWGWHTVRSMTKFTMLRAIVSDFQMTQAMIVSSAKLGLWFEDSPCNHEKFAWPACALVLLWLCLVHVPCLHIKRHWRNRFTPH